VLIGKRESFVFDKRFETNDSPQQQRRSNHSSRTTDRDVERSQYSSTGCCA
jgi:hypothetical protein